MADYIWRVYVALCMALCMALYMALYVELYVELCVALYLALYCMYQIEERIRPQASKPQSLLLQPLSGHYHKGPLYWNIPTKIFTKYIFHQWFIFSSLICQRENLGSQMISGIV